MKSKAGLVLMMVGQSLALNFAKVYQQSGSTSPVVCARPEGGYLLAMGEVSAGYRLTLLWLGDTGEIQQAYGYTYPGNPTNILRTSDGGYIITGDGPSGKTVLKISPTGVVQWATSHPDLYELTCVAECSDGSILVGGTAYPNSRKRPALWKINGSTGATLWDLYYWNEGTSDDAFSLKGVCDFPTNSSYYAVIVRTKIVSIGPPPEIYLYPAILEVRPADGRASIGYYGEFSAQSTTILVPAGLLVSGNQMLASWAHRTLGQWYRANLWVSGLTNASGVELNSGLSPQADLPLASSPDGCYYTLSAPRLTKLNAQLYPIWSVSISNYSSGGYLSVAPNADPVVTYISSGYAYPTMLARMESSNGFLCITSAISSPEPNDLGVRVEGVTSINQYDLGNPTSLSVSRVSVSPLVQNVCNPVYEEEDEHYYTSGAEMRALAIAGRVNVELILPAGAEVSLSVFDATGRLYAILFNGPLLPGSHRFATNAKPGVYTVVARTDGAYLVRTVVVGQ